MRGLFNRGFISYDLLRFGGEGVESCSVAYRKRILKSCLYKILGVNHQMDYQLILVAGSIQLSNEIILDYYSVLACAS